MDSGGVRGSRRLLARARFRSTQSFQLLRRWVRAWRAAGCRRLTWVPNGRVVAELRPPCESPEVEIAKGVDDDDSPSVVPVVGAHGWVRPDQVAMHGVDPVRIAVVHLLPAL